MARIRENSRSHNPGIRAALVERAVLSSSRMMQVRVVDGEKYVSPWPRILTALEAGGTVELSRWQIPVHYRPPGQPDDRVRLTTDDRIETLS
ncbi:hypothetical protein [Rhodococcus sp. JG-3]|uniref:hypothetical protein n=1 Tax=Rhodococcus sp. JG-3 TaxID=1305835 RepID=UPI000482DA72|nr:hypothetical protein [Rhodococcus sp. JG-3]